MAEEAQGQTEKAEDAVVEARIKVGEIVLEGKLEEEKGIDQDDENWEYACFAAGSEDAWEDVFNEDGNISRETDAWVWWAKAAARSGKMTDEQVALVEQDRAEAKSEAEREEGYSE